MIQALLVALAAVFLAYLGGREKNRSSLLLLAFALLTLFLSLGYYWGNDVSMYEEWYDNFEKKGIAWWDFSQYDSFSQKEYGFIWINLLLKPFGFWGMRAVLFCIENYIVYYFIKTHVKKKWHWLAVFIYVFNPNFWVLSSSMMRQWLAMCVVLLGAMSLEKGRVLRYVLMSLVAFSIHFSAIVTLAFLPVFFLQKKNTMQSLYILIACLIGFWLLSPFFIDYVALFLKAEDFYQLGYMDTHGGFGITSIAFMLLYTFILYCSIKTKQQHNLPCWIVMLAALVMPLLAYGELISRIGFYFSIFTLAAFPLFMDNPKVDKASKTAVISFVILYDIYSFFLFFHSPTWIKAFGSYHTIIGNL